MKKVLAWLKVNWPIVVCSLVILVALPAGVIIGGSYQQKLINGVKEAVDADYKDLSADKMTYDIPAPIPGQPKFDFAGQAPNAKVIAAFAEKRKELLSELGSVAGHAVEFNRGDHKPLIEGFFPDPPTAAQQKRAEFTLAYIALGDKLMSMVNAGVPPSTNDVMAALSTYRDQQFTKAKTELGVDDKDIPADRRMQIRDALIQMRADLYSARAREISVYLERSMIEAIPEKRPDRDWDMRESWDRQERAWMLEDLFKAIKKVNDEAAAESGSSGVPASVVKRVMGMDVRPHPLIANPPSAVAEDPLALPVEAGPAGPVVVQLDQRRVSGRYSGPSAKNNAFDVRQIDTSLVVSTHRLPKLFDALTETNFITVVIANVQQLPVKEQLDLGYYYGDEHVVKVDLRLEWCWLREWTGPLMPAEVKKQIGYKEPKEAADEGPKKPKPGGG